MAGTGTIGHIRRKVAKFWRNCRGSSAVVFGLSLVPMALAAGGAVDYTRYYEVRRELQTALDAATLAGATANNNSTVAGSTFSHWKTDSDSTVSTPQFSATETETSSTYAGTVNASLKMYFTSLVGIDQMDMLVTSRAVRTITTSDTGGNCMWLLNTGLTLNSKARLDANLCLVIVLGGSSSFGAFSGMASQELCIKSGLDLSLASLLTLDLSALLTIERNCTKTNTLTLPKAPGSSGCDYTSQTYTDAIVALKPGTYCGGMNFNGNDKNNPMQITFRPGTYILKNGSFNISGFANVTGDGVTFYYADSGSYLQFNSSNITSTLSAPTSGSCMYSGTCGVLMYEAADLSLSNFSGFDAGTTNTWTGNVLLPSRSVSLNSQAQLHLTGVLELSGLLLNASSYLKINPQTGNSARKTYSIARLVE